MNNMQNGISKKIFMWVIGIIITAGLSVAGYLVGKVDKVEETFNHNVTDNKEDISAMRVDISWIKEAVKK